jgi:hypothetical protein
MKTAKIALLIAMTAAYGAADTRKVEGKPDFYAYNPDGSVKMRGVYQTDAKGRVVKYTVFDGAGRLQYTEVPYYAEDGRMIRADEFNARGNLAKVVVYFDNFTKVLDGDGKVIDTQSFSQKELLKSDK